MLSRANGCFQLPTTLGKLKRKGEKKVKRDTTNDESLKGIVSYQIAFEKLLLLHEKHTGAWLIVRDITVNGTVLATTKFRDVYEIVTMLSPPILKKATDA